jgi:signal transduction histidine kinase
MTSEREEKQQSQDSRLDSMQVLETLIHMAQEGRGTLAFRNPDYERQLDDLEKGHAELKAGQNQLVDLTAQMSETQRTLVEHHVRTNELLEHFQDMWSPFAGLKKFITFLGSIPVWLIKSNLGRGVLLTAAIVVWLVKGDDAWLRQLLHLPTR